MNSRSSLSRVAVFWFCVILGIVALVYLGFKTYQVADRPGYDFRFIWLAGDLWLEGINPYGDAYEPAGIERISQGHVPTLWPYPPTWWIFSTPFGALNLYDANVAWNMINIVFVVGGIMLLSNAFVVAFPEKNAKLTARFGGWAAVVVFCIVLFLFSVLEATAILFSVGQTTLFACFGIALMLWSRVRKVIWLEALGLALVLLKPQIGLQYAILLLLLDARSRQTALLAGLFSIGLMVPAMFTEPFVIFDFIRNVSNYDGFTDANLPLSMTGIRLVLFEFLGTDIGNLAAVACALAAIILTCAGPMRLSRSQNPAIHSWQVISLSTAVIVAVAPLHIYDFVLLVVPLPLLFCATRLGAFFAVAGAALIWRSENLAALTRFHDLDVEIFPGSRLATIGAILFLIGVAMTVAQFNTQDP